jgi:hypothetical protein
MEKYKKPSNPVDFTGSGYGQVLAGSYDCIDGFAVAVKGGRLLD